MIDYSHEVLSNYMVRKSRKQKTAFLDRTKEVLEEQGYVVSIEEGGLMRHRNLVVGEVEKAEVIYSAHYDTCPVMPVPNFITPKNFLVFILYQLFLTVLILGIAVFAGGIVSIVINNELLGALTTILLTLLCCFQIIGGIPNPKTYNDNTSGVVTLIELAHKLSVEQREKAAFVFFDNEELGLLGSSLFSKMHHKKMKNTLLVNFDCVSDGDHLLVIANKRMRKDVSQYALLKECLTSSSEKKIRHLAAASTIYPSDQMNFKKTIAVAAVHKAPVLGYYMARIHTPFDTRFDERNIELLSDAMVAFTKKL